MKLITPVILDVSQKLLMHYQKKQVLDSESSSSESELDDVETIKSLNSKNPFIKLMILGRINQNVQKFLQKE